MKKLYTLLFLVASAITLNAQTTENFNDINTTAAGNSYADGSFTGVEGIAWTYVKARSVSSLSTADQAYAIDGNGVVLRRTDEAGKIEGVFPNGISTFSFQWRKAYTGNTYRQLQILVNGQPYAVTEQIPAATGANPQVYTYSAALNQAGPVTVAIMIKGDSNAESIGRQVTIDNFTWTNFTAGLKDNSIAGLKLFPNPLSGNVLNVTSNSSADKTIAVYDVLGKNVLNAKVTNETVNVAALTSGVYIVKITEEGKTATRKLVVK